MYPVCIADRVSVWNGRRFGIEWDGEGVFPWLLLAWGVRFRFFLLYPPPPSRRDTVVGVYRFLVAGLYRPRGYKAEKKFHLLFLAFPQ